MSGAFFPPPVSAAPSGLSSSRRSVERSRERSPRRSRSPQKRRSRSRSRTPPSRPSVKNRAECTVFVSQLHPKIDDMDLFEFFSHVGRVEDIQLIKDPRTGRSKGLAYVEFTTKDDALKSQVLNGQLVGGYPITIAMPQTEKGSSSSSKKGGPTPSATPPEGLRIYVGSLNFNITESDIRPIFEAFGPLTSVEIHRDTNTGQSKGFGFISFALRADAETAMAALEGVEVGGRPIKIGHASPTENAKNPRPAVSVLPGAPLMVLPHGLGGVTPTNAAAAPPSAPALPPLTTAQLIPSSALLVKNMFDPSTETDPEWWKDLEEDVREEVSKYGTLSHISVDQTNPSGLVWMRFEQVDAAQQAQKALHGRWFSSRQLTAEFIPETTYATQFP